MGHPYKRNVVFTRPYRRIDAPRLTGWLCLVAVWLQVLLPVALHSTAMAEIPSLVVFAADADDDDGCALEQGADHDADHDRDGDRHNSSAHGGCLACQAMHFMVGGCAASASAGPLPALVHDVSIDLPQDGGPVGPFVSSAFQARAPPGFFDLSS